jgi:hypothetical protein
MITQEKIFILKNLLSNYTYKILIYLKIIFVTIIVLITIIPASIQIIFESGKTFNNILEWNYFCFLLIFYLLSTKLWKKKLINNAYFLKLNIKCLLI